MREAKNVYIEEQEPNVQICECCERKVSREDMLWTRDCHGIVFRLVCKPCWEKLMAEGYDGEPYSELDECLDSDY